jgi:hypothetical protein
MFLLEMWRIILRLNRKINRKCNFQTKEILMTQNTELFKAKRKEIGIKRRLESLNAKQTRGFESGHLKTVASRKKSMI